MEKMFKKAFALLLVLMLAMSLTGCNNANNGGGEGGDTGSKSITIAVAAPMTGDNAEYGIGFANAAKLMASEWNAKGGEESTAEVNEWYAQNH